MWCICEFLCEFELNNFINKYMTECILSRACIRAYRSVLIADRLRQPSKISKTLRQVLDGR